MKKLTLVFVALVMAAGSPAAQSPTARPFPTGSQSAAAAQQAATDAQSRLEFMQAQLADAQRRNEFLNAQLKAQSEAQSDLDDARSRLLVFRVDQMTGVKLVADRVEPARDGVAHASGKVTLTFQGGVITADDVVVGSDGTIHILGNSQMTLSRSR